MARSTVAPILFADVFGVTAVDGRGVARSKPLPYGCHGFDAKPPYVAVCGSSYLMHVFDAKLRPAGAPQRPMGTLTPDGALVGFSQRTGALTIQGVAEESALALPPPQRELSLTNGPARGTRSRDFPRVPVLADDGGFALPTFDRTVRLGHLDLAAGTIAHHALVHVAPSHATKRVFLPGRARHVLAALDRASSTLEVVVIDADGSTSRHTHEAIGLPAREGDALWFQRDAAHVVRVGLDGSTPSVVSLPADHRGPGTVFAQRGEGWFVPWHAEAVLSLARGTVIDRKLPGDAVRREHLARLRRRLHEAGRAAGVGLSFTSVRMTGGAKPTVHLSMNDDGGDEGPLAHCVIGLARMWHRWAPPPVGTGHLATGGGVIALRAFGVDEVRAAVATLAAHGLPVRASAWHWAQVLRYAEEGSYAPEALRALVSAIEGVDEANEAERERVAPAGRSREGSVAALEAIARGPVR